MWRYLKTLKILELKETGLDSLHWMFQGMDDCLWLPWSSLSTRAHPWPVQLFAKPSVAELSTWLHRHLQQEFFCFESINSSSRHFFSIGCECWLGFHQLCWWGKQSFTSLANLFCYIHLAVLNTFPSICYQIITFGIISTWINSFGNFQNIGIKIRCFRGTNMCIFWLLIFIEIFVSIVIPTFLEYRWVMTRIFFSSYPALFIRLWILHITKLLC